MFKRLAIQTNNGANIEYFTKFFNLNIGDKEISGIGYFEQEAQTITLGMYKKDVANYAALSAFFLDPISDTFNSKVATINRTKFILFDELDKIIFTGYCIVSINGSIVEPATGDMYELTLTNAIGCFAVAGDIVAPSSIFDDYGQDEPYVYNFTNYVNLIEQVLGQDFRALLTNEAQFEVGAIQANEVLSGYSYMGNIFTNPWDFNGEGNSYIINYDGDIFYTPGDGDIYVYNYVAVESGFSNGSGNVYFGFEHVRSYYVREFYTVLDVVYERWVNYFSHKIYRTKYSVQDGVYASLVSDYALVNEGRDFSRRPMFIRESINWQYNTNFITAAQLKDLDTLPVEWLYLPVVNAAFPDYNLTLEGGLYQISSDLSAMNDEARAANVITFDGSIAIEQFNFEETPTYKELLKTMLKANNFALKINYGLSYDQIKIVNKVIAFPASDPIIVTNAYNIRKATNFISSSDLDFGNLRNSTQISEIAKKYYAQLFSEYTSSVSFEMTKEDYIDRFSEGDLIQIGNIVVWIMKTGYKFSFDDSFLTFEGLGKNV